MASGDATVSREFEIVIEAAPARVWAALISPEYTTEWWFANTVESSWEPGAPIRYLGEDGLPYVLGEVLESDPPHRLVTTLHPVWSEDVRGHGGTRVDWTLEAADHLEDPESTRVTLVHSGVVPGSALDHETAPGWTFLLESLRKLVEH